LLEEKRKVFMQGKLCKGEGNVTYNNSILELWHRIFRYMSAK